MQERGPLKALERGYAIATDAAAMFCETPSRWQLVTLSLFNFIAADYF